jgi:ubiquinone/menaquinone biosynthesis C-methylase UbiE
MEHRQEELRKNLAELHELQRDYTRLGEEDPFFWTVGNSDPDLERYFADGRTQVAAIEAQLRRLGANVAPGRALDFACGIGRVTQALATKYQEAHGLDISPSMIERANALNRNPQRCHFHVHCGERLDLFEDHSFDLVLAINVLPYIPPSLTKGYLREFLRVLKPSGFGYFQTVQAVFPRTVFPAALLGHYRKIKHRRNRSLLRADRFHIAEQEVRTIITAGGGRIVHVEASAVPTFWTAHEFFVARQEPATGSVTFGS